VNTPSAKRTAVDLFGPNEGKQALKVLSALDLKYSTASDSFQASNLLELSRGELGKLKELVKETLDGDLSSLKMLPWLRIEQHFEQGPQSGLLAWFAPWIDHIAKHAVPLNLSPLTSHSTLRLSVDGQGAEVFIKPDIENQQAWLCHDHEPDESSIRCVDIEHLERALPAFLAATVQR
jgi:hypothetical protein